MYINRMCICHVVGQEGVVMNDNESESINFSGSGISDFSKYI